MAVFQMSAPVPKTQYMELGNEVGTPAGSAILQLPQPVVEPRERLVQPQYAMQEQMVPQYAMQEQIVEIPRMVPSVVMEDVQVPQVEVSEVWRQMPKVEGPVVRYVETHVPSSVVTRRHRA